MTATSIVTRPADEVFAYVTDPTYFHEWQLGVVPVVLDALDADRLRRIDRLDHQ